MRAALLDLESGEIVSLANGVLTRVHAAGECAGKHCWVHIPSQHPLREAPVAVVDGVAVRLCPHWDDETGTGAHPDPDDAHYRNRHATKYVGWIDRAGEALHTCCCHRCCEVDE